MAVSFIGSASAAYTTATATFALPAPSGTLTAGDVVVANIVWDTATTAAVARTLPSGWSTITGVLQMGTGTVAMNFEAAAHVVTSAEASSPPASWAVDNGAAYVGNAETVLLRGVDTADLLAVSSPAAGFSYAVVDPGSATKIAPEVVTDAADAMLVTGGGMRSNSTTIISVDTGYTLDASSAAQAAGRCGGIAHKLMSGSGASGAATWTNSSSNTGLVWQTALKPLVATGPAAPTVNAGADASVNTNAPFTRTATEADGGAAITARAWTIVSGPSGAGSTIGTAAALSWTPTVAGTYVLRYSATNSIGTGSDDVTVTATTPPEVTPVLVHRVLGIPTTTTACMTARTTGAVTVRMQVCASSSFASGVLTGPSVAPNAQGDAQLTVSGLTAGTAYYQRVAMTNSAGTETFSAASSKTFRTAPAGQASYSFSFASCDSASDTTTWTTVANRSDDFFLMLGDMYYADGTGNDLPNFRAKMVAKIEATNHVKVFAATPTLYGASDHDGMNNGSTAASDPTAWTNWNTAYRELWPNPGIPATAGVYKTFVWGRVRFIQLDTRTFSSDNAATDNSSKTRLGATQKQWLKDTITAATEPVIVLVQADPWIGTAIATGDTGWLSYNTERQELGSFFAASGKNIALLAGDMHAVAADDGTSVNNPGHIAVFHGSPMQNTSSLKGGPFTVGPYPTSAGVSVRQYARITVTDTGSAVALDYRAYDDANTQLLALTKTYTVPGTAITVTGPRAPARATTATITQSTAILTTPARSASRTTRPTLAQAATVTTSAARASTRADAPTLAHNAALTVTAARAATTATRPQLEQIAPGELNTSHARASTRATMPTLGQAAALTVADARATTAATTVLLAGGGALATTPARAATRATIPTLAQLLILAANGARAPTRSSRPVLTDPDNTVTTPATRTAIVGPENRTEIVAAENRTVTA